MQDPRPLTRTQLTNTASVAIGAVVAIATLIAWDVIGARSSTPAGFVAAASAAQDPAIAREVPADAPGFVQLRWQDDLRAMTSYRPGYPFWQHIFTVPDGHIAYGSAVDGRLLAIFPAKGDWIHQARWVETSLAGMLDGHELPRSLDDRRDYVAQLLERVVGPILHNPTRGQFLTPNAERYGRFLAEWSAIYDRFGVPAEIGLAQAILESGWNGERRSKAGAIGFCQWLARNWKVLDKISDDTIESKNQTTQAPYCAAYLTILATKYGSFIPALSEHHSGGTNVGRTLINGQRLGGENPRERYFLGAQLARDLRTIASGEFSDLYRTYGPRSYFYAEMTFGNGLNVTRIAESTPQAKIYAMRTSRPLLAAEITRRAKISADELRRYNPALAKKVPAGATLYLPVYIKDFGRDVSFWHREAPASYTRTLNEFLRLEAAGERWDDPGFEPVLRGFQRRFADTNSEEGDVMATTLSYAIQEMYTSGRTGILREFRSSDQIRELFERGIRTRDAVRAANAGN